MQKNIIVIIASFLLGCAVTAGIGYYFFLGPDRLSLAAVRVELAEYRDRALDSEARLGESISIISAGEAKLTGSITTLRDAISKIQIIRGIIADIKDRLTIKEQDNNHSLGY